MAVLEIHQVPVRYSFRKSKQNVDDMLHISHLIHKYLHDGGDPRKVHFTYPDLKCINQSITMTTKVANGSNELQRTSFPVVLIKDEEVSDVA